jgi:hypothetical protein
MSKTISTHLTAAVTVLNASDNPVTILGSGGIDSTGSLALYGAGPTAWTVSNAGKISAAGANSDGIKLMNGGNVSNTGSIYGTTAAIIRTGPPST